MTVALALTGCNIFNPEGAAKASCSGSDINCYMLLGQTLIQDKDFPGAMNAYKKAISLDSTRSEAYWGYARAAVYKFNINTGELLGDLSDAGTGNINAFMDHPDQVLTDRIRLAYEVVKTIDALAGRDTLTLAWRYLNDSARYSDQPHYAARKAFILNYLDTVTAPSRKREKFPLTDGRKTFQGLIIEYTAYRMMYQILDFNDLGEKLLFNESDRKMRGLLNSDGSFGGLGDLAAEMENDTVLQQQVNDKIVDLQNGLGNLTDLLGSLGITNDTSGGAEAQTKAKMDSAISGLGGSLVFYQFGDRLDNDADGCIDEEIVDSLDNDLDGFVDEDARLIKGTGTLGDPGDQVNNNRAGGVDDALENRAGPILSATRPYILTFVANYLAGAGEVNTPEKETTWIKVGAKKGEPGIDFRIALQADSLAVRLNPTAPGYSVPPQYQAKLDSAKALIGGCWRNY